MLIDTEKMIPITRLQKELAQRLRQVTETGEPLYVLKNNEMSAVLLSAEEYDLLKDAEEIVEHLEIAGSIEKRLKKHDLSKNIAWEKIKKKHGL